MGGGPNASQSGRGDVPKSDITSPTIHLFTFQGNRGNTSGGALLLGTSDSTNNMCIATVANTRFMGNFASVRGAGVAMNPKIGNNFTAR